MTQATNQGRDPDLAVALFRAVRGLKRRSVPGPTQGPGFDGAALMALHLLGGLGPTRLSDLAAEVGLDVSTVSRHVRSLEQAGYVARTVHPDDGRATLLAVTEPGREVLAASLSRSRAALDAALTTWTDQDRRDLTALVSRLADDLAPRTPLAPSPDRTRDPIPENA